MSGSRLWLLLQVQLNGVPVTARFLLRHIWSIVGLLWSSFELHLLWKLPMLLIGLFERTPGNLARYSMPGFFLVAVGLGISVDLFPHRIRLVAAERLLLGGKRCYRTIAFRVDGSESAALLGSYLRMLVR